MTSTIAAGRTANQFLIRETNSWTGATTSWTDIPNAITTVTVHPRTQRLLATRFIAESYCTGPSGWASVRIVVVASDGTTTELQPDAGTDFAFDSANGTGNDNYESHAVERSSFEFLSAGTYTVKAQAILTNGATSFRLDNWHFSVEVIEPAV